MTLWHIDSILELVEAPAALVSIRVISLKEEPIQISKLNTGVLAAIQVLYFPSSISCNAREMWANQNSAINSSLVLLSLLDCLGHNRFLDPVILHLNWQVLFIVCGTIGFMFNTAAIYQLFLPLMANHRLEVRCFETQFSLSLCMYNYICPAQSLPRW